MCVCSHLSCLATQQFLQQCASLPCLISSPIKLQFWSHTFLPRASPPTPGVPLTTVVHTGVAFLSTGSLTEMQTGRQSQDPFSRNSLHTRMFTQPGNQTITNHHLAHCQTYQKPTYASMQCIIYNFLRQSPYTSRKARCLKCVCIYICLFTKLS